MKTKLLLALAIPFGLSGGRSNAWADESKPLFSLDVMADVQYGDKDTLGRRHYRTAIEKRYECVE